MPPNKANLGGEAGKRNQDDLWNTKCKRSIVGREQGAPYHSAYMRLLTYSGEQLARPARAHQVADYCPKGLVDLEETNHHANTDVPHKTDATVV